MNDSVQKSRTLMMYELLETRKTLTRADRDIFYQERTGYEGELYFSKLLQEKMSVEHIVLYSILFDRDGSIAQIDCILILPTKIVLVEVKNFAGEYSFVDDTFMSMRSEKTYQNPLHQLNRTEIYLRHVLDGMDVHLPVQSYVVFVNDGFTLYTKPNNKIILPTQLDGFLKYLNKETLQLTEEHVKVADQLRRMHMVDNPYEKIPLYNWEELRKGITCHHCRGWMKRRRYTVWCHRCNEEESIRSAILRHTAIFNTLFPEQQITTRRIREFMGGNVAERTVRMHLKQYLEKKAVGKATYYVM